MAVCPFTDVVAQQFPAKYVKDLGCVGDVGNAFLTLSKFLAFECVRTLIPNEEYFFYA